MKRKIRQLFIFNENEKEALEKLAELKQVSQCELVRTLIRDEAMAVGLWSEARSEMAIIYETT